jgi:seryl-tRNA(Sec) selenium transferase
MLHRDKEWMATQAERLMAGLEGLDLDLSIVDCDDPVGGGSHPGEVLEGLAVAISKHGVNLTALAQCMRQREIPVIGVIRDERLMLHVRTLESSDIEVVVRAVKEAVTSTF